jgi:multidrug efflux pump subunit AcrA (membrane-fusion protein)
MSPHEDGPYLVPLDDPRIGSFREVRPRYRARRLAVVLAAVFAGLLVLFALVPWQQTSYGEGQVVAYSPSERQQRVDAPVDGWVVEWFVQEGSRVEAGDPLVRLEDNDPQLLARLEVERRAVAARVRAAESAEATARRNVERQRELLGQGLSSRKQYEEAQLKVADVLKELTGARAAVAQLDTRVARLDRQVVRAPRSGTILRRLAGAEAVYVKVGQELAQLVPDTGSRALELWLDGNDLPLLQRGREVRVQFEGWPALQFSGWPGASVGTFGGRVDVVDAAGVAGAGALPGSFRVLVTPTDDPPWPPPDVLRQGVQAHAWVLLEEVTLGYELWRRFNNFPPLRPRTDAAPKGKAGGEDKAGGDKAAGGSEAK